jgi:arylformamidase
LASDGAGPGISETLEREYNLRIRHPERDAVYRGFAERSRAHRARGAARLDLRYAEGPRCTLDFFPGRGASAPLLVFIHGGYWRALDKSIFSFIAQPFGESGAAVALLGYDLAPVVTLTTIVAEVHEALAWLATERTLEFDRTRVVLSGHSAGGHLAALLAAAPASKLGGIEPRAVVAVSGLFDLLPLLETSVNLDVRMSVDEARTMSPIRIAAFTARRFVVAVGDLETDGFVTQSRDFAAHVQSPGCESRFVAVAGRTHFDVLDDLADVRQPLGRHTLELLFG